MKILKRAFTFLLSFTTLTSLTGCATIMQGTRQTVGIASNPSNACILGRQCVCRKYSIDR